MSTQRIGTTGKLPFRQTPVSDAMAFPAHPSYRPKSSRGFAVPSTRGRLAKSDAVAPPPLARGIAAGHVRGDEGSDPAGDPITDLKTASSAPTESERTLEKALGHQVRQMRRERDLSVSDLAAAAGISLGMVSKIENGLISPSLSTINALATALNVPITAMFTAFEEKRDCSHVRAGQGVTIERRGTKAGHIYELLGAALGGDLVVEPYLITLCSEAEAYTGFRHAGIEFIYMLTGEVIYHHAGRDYPLKPGDALLFDSAGLHGPATLIETPMTYLSIIIYPRG